MTPRTFFIAVLAIACCFAVGCYPSNETNIKDERSVRQATPTDLDESAIRRIIQLEGAERVWQF
jgi:hypothetical protein